MSYKPAFQMKRTVSLPGEQYKGKNGEITFDPKTKNVHVHDGETVGGIVLAKLNEMLELMSNTNKVLFEMTKCLDAITKQQIDNTNVLTDVVKDVLPTMTTLHQKTIDCLAKFFGVEEQTEQGDENV